MMPHEIKQGPTKSAYRNLIRRELSLLDVPASGRAQVRGEFLPEVESLCSMVSKDLNRRDGSCAIHHAFLYLTKSGLGCVAAPYGHETSSVYSTTIAADVEARGAPVMVPRSFLLAVASKVDMLTSANLRLIDEGSLAVSGVLCGNKATLVYRGGGYVTGEAKTFLSWMAKNVVPYV